MKKFRAKKVNGGFHLQEKNFRKYWWPFWNTIGKSLNCTYDEYEHFIPFVFETEQEALEFAKQC